MMKKSFAERKEEFVLNYAQKLWTIQMRVTYMEDQLRLVYADAYLIFAVATELIDN